MLASGLRRAWHSPQITSIVATGVRAVAYLVPVPLIQLHFSDAHVALWFLIISFQALTSSVIGNLPIILMQMISYTQANKRDEAEPAKEAQLKFITTNVSRTFTFLSAVWLLFAAVVATPLIWRQVSLTEDIRIAVAAWIVFVAGATFRILLLGYTTYLIGLGNIAMVRRTEAQGWLVGSLLSATVLAVHPNFLLAMIGLQLPVLLNYLQLRRSAHSKGWERAGHRKLVPDEAFVSDVLPKAWRGFIGIAVSYFITYGSSVIYAQVGTSQGIARFSFAVTVFGLIMQLSNSQTISTLPKLAVQYAEKDHKVLRESAARILTSTLFVYVLMCASAWATLRLIDYIYDKSLPEIGDRLWVLFMIAYLFSRYASFHLHLYTVTNDIKWHIVHIGTGIVYAASLALLGIGSLTSFPIARIAASLIFSIPYARLITLRRLGYSFSKEKLPLSIFAVQLVLFLALLFRT
jgi:hypothetical protein